MSTFECLFTAAENLSSGPTSPCGAINGTSIFLTEPHFTINVIIFFWHIPQQTFHLLTYAELLPTIPCKLLCVETRYMAIEYLSRTITGEIWESAMEPENEPASSHKESGDL